MRIFYPSLSGHPHRLHPLPTPLPILIHPQFQALLLQTILDPPALWSLCKADQRPKDTASLLTCHCGHCGPVGSVPCTQPLLDSHRKTHLPVCWVQQMCVHLRPFEYALSSAAKVLPKPASGSFPPSLCWPQLAGQLNRSHWMVSLRCFTLSTDLITRITGCHKSSHFSDMPHTPPYSQILLSPSMLYKQRGREWVITTNKWQCGAGPQAVTLQADGAVQCTACTAVHCGRRARAIIDLPVCSVRFVVNFEWPHLKQMKE